MFPPHFHSLAMTFQHFRSPPHPQRRFFFDPQPSPSLLHHLEPPFQQYHPIPTDPSPDCQTSKLLWFPPSPSFITHRYDILDEQRLLEADCSVYRCIISMESKVSAIAECDKLLYTASVDMKSIFVSTKPLLSECRQIAEGFGDVKALLVMGDKVYSAHGDKKIRVWYRDTEGRHSLMATLPTLRDYLYNFILSKNYRQVRRHHKRLWIEHFDTITALALSVRVGLLYSTSWDKTVKVWRLSDCRCVESINAHDDAVNTLVVRWDGTLYTGSADSTVKMWKRISVGKTVKHEHVATLEGHESAVNAVALSSDEQLLYSAGWDCLVRVWKEEEEEERACLWECLRGHTRPILCMAVCGSRSSSGILCSGSADTTVRVWKRGVESSCHLCIAILDGHEGPVKCLSASADSRGEARCVIYSGSMDWSVKVWNISATEEDNIDEP